MASPPPPAGRKGTDTSNTPSASPPGRAANPEARRASEHVAKATRSRGNPFLPAAQDRNSFPLALLRLAGFRSAPRWALAKTGALRQPRLRGFVHWTRLARLPPGDKIWC